MRHHKVVLFRGPQGSGKSTAAESFCAREKELVHLEADDYYLDERGVYHFREEDHALAHLSCKKEAKSWISLGYVPVISNTFSLKREINDYLTHLAVTPEETLVITCHRGWSAERYAERSIHSVPVRVIAELLARWEPWDGEQVIVGFSTLR